MGKTQLSKARRKVAHAQPSNGSAEKRYNELCKSIPEHNERCLQQANSLMTEMWAMAEEVHELKGVCKMLRKPYEAEAIKLCGGETAFHYLCDLYTAFTGNRHKALECAKAPYTLLREFRAERAAKNREKKCLGAEKYRGKYFGTANKNAICVQKTSATDGSVEGDMAGGGHTTVLIADLRDELTAEQYRARRNEIERTRLKGAIYVQKNTGKRFMATGAFNGVWTDVIPESQDNEDLECPSEPVHYADLVLEEDSLEDLDATEAKPALPTESFSTQDVEMQPQVIDVVGEPLATDEDAHPVDGTAHTDHTQGICVDELAQFKDAKEKADVFIKCSLFGGDVHKALDFLKTHFIEDNTCAVHTAAKENTTAKKRAKVRGAKRAMKQATKRKASTAKKRGTTKTRIDTAKTPTTTNPADTPWPPPIACGEVAPWGKAKKGQYVTWCPNRVMVIDRIQGSEIVLEDPFYPKGEYPIRVTHKAWDHVLGTTEERVTSEFVRVRGKVPAIAGSANGDAAVVATALPKTPTIQIDYSEDEYVEITE
jgi:hypothetical protein